MGLDEATLETLTSDREKGKVFTLPVTVPQDGLVIQKHLDPGEATAAGKDVLTIADLSSVWVWLNVYEQDLARLLGEAKKGSPRVRITTLAFPEKTFEGEINLIGSMLDEHDRTIKVRAMLKNDDALLRPGMFCAAQVVFDTPEQILAVPTHAVVADAGKQFLFRLVRDHFALRTDVQVGRTFVESLEIVQGVSEGDKIVGRGAFLLKSDVLREKMGAGCAD
jgi:cobalt-zinc-cadmium efflux system membrane fusion protein